MNNLIKILEQENSKEKPDVLYIKTLRSAITSQQMTLELFSNTGRFSPRSVLASTSPNTMLHPMCVNVVTYIGGFFIQVLKDGTYYIEDGTKGIKRKRLSTLELYIWLHDADEMFNRES